MFSPFATLTISFLYFLSPSLPLVEYTREESEDNGVTTLQVPANDGSHKEVVVEVELSIAACLDDPHGTFVHRLSLTQRFDGCHHGFSPQGLGKLVVSQHGRTHFKCASNQKPPEKYTRCPVSDTSA